jgi:hypothetical protein
MMKFEPKDYVALVTAALTIGSVVWKGGQITAQLEATNESVKQLIPVVGRLDVLTGKLEAVTEASRARIDEHGRRLDLIDQELRVGRGK